MREVERRMRRGASSVLCMVASLVAGVGYVHAQEPTVPADAAAAPAPVESAPETAPQATPSEAAPAQPTSEQPAPIPPPEQAAQPIPPMRAGISGVVLDRETREPLAGARVLIEGNGRRRVRVTDEEGRFEANLRSGTYSVRAVSPMYRSARRSAVRVDRGRRTTVEMPLRLFEADEEIVDVAIHIDRSSEGTQMVLRRESAAVSDNLGQEEMRRTGDGRTDQAVRRVVGASIEEGSRLVVRGLGDRYSAVMLNGVQLPSTDPDRQGIQLDLIPTAVLANLSIVKSATPDLYANWAGGLMQLESISFPEEFTLRGGVSLGINSFSTFRNQLDYSGGRFDWLGVDDGTRALSDASQNRYVGIFPDWFTAEDIRQIVADETNTRAFSRRMSLPQMSANFTLGDSIELRNDRRFGYLLSANYTLTDSRRVGPTRRLLTLDRDPNDPNSYSYFYDSEVGRRDTLWTTFGTATFQYSPRGNIRAVALYTRTSADETRRYVGPDISSDLDYLDQWQLSFVSRAVSFVQLVGEQRELPLPPHSTLRWSVYTTSSRVEQPGTWQIGYTRQLDNASTPFSWRNRANSGDRIDTELSQRDYGGYLHLRSPLWEGATLSMGGDIRVSSRDSQFRQFQFLTDGNAPSDDFYELPADQLFDAANYGQGIRYLEISRPTDSYRATQSWLAGFLMLDTEMGRYLRLIGGVRAEVFRQDLQAGLLIDGPMTPGVPPPVQPSVHRTDVNWLPSGSLVVSPIETMNVRLAYGMTVSRPQLREIAPLKFYDFVRRRTTEGDPQLRTTLIHNVDLRWEWFFGETDILAASVFYKRFNGPIDELSPGGGVDDLRFKNAESAYDVGFEIEGRLGLGALTNALRFFSIGGNVAIVRSRLTYTEEQQVGIPEGDRPFLSQAPYVANLSLRFDHPDEGLQLSLVYNALGPRFVAPGFTYGDGYVPDFYEQAFHSLDFIGSWEMSEHVQLRWSIKNMLNQQRRTYQSSTFGQVTERSYTPGVDFQVGLNFMY